MDDEDHFNLAYTSSFTPEQHSNSLTSGNYQASNVDKYVETRMHNVTLQYHSGSGFDVGGDYTHYTSDNNQTLFADYADGAQSGFSIIGGQKIDRYSIYVDRKRSLAKEWDLGYGMSYRFAKDRDFQTYDKVTGDIPTENTDSRLREQTANVYVSLSKNYATGTSVSISATGEYYTIGNYRKWAVYPQASLTYVKSSEHLFQFSLSTDKTYPGYWDMQSSVSHLNGYTELWGTPGLKPSTAYIITNILQGIVKLPLSISVGGNANIPGLAKVLQQKLGYRVTTANPFLQMGFSPQIDIKKIESDAPSLLVACGLAMRSFD